jgi:hypothetical protein
MVKLNRRIHGEDNTHDGGDETCLSLQGAKISSKGISSKGLKYFGTPL